MRRRRSRTPDLPPEIGRHPLVAILGRPNVGKSTIFNRLVGRRASIVEDHPGVTRDRILADADIDGRTCTLVDTGGFELDPEGSVEEGVNRHCRAILERADLVLFVVDGRSAPTSGDLETAALLRKAGTPCILVVNKVDGARQEAEAADAFSLGVEPAVLVSALHGRGFGDLEDLIARRLPDGPEAEPPEVGDPAIRVAIIGRPNAGKSSLVNRLLGEERLLALEEPGTTRDAVDSRLEREGRSLVLIDTAGIRRRRSVPSAGPERLAVASAVRAVERCHVAVMIIDAAEGAAEQDAKVLGLAVDRGRAAVLALNKWDLLSGEEEAGRAAVSKARDKLSFVTWARIVRISAATGRGLDKLLGAVDDAWGEFSRRVPTAELNLLFEDIAAHHPPPLRKGRPVKMYYAAQTGVRPPTFAVQCSYPEALHFSYRRYVQNRIREAFGFEGTPLRVHFKKRRRRED